MVQRRTLRLALAFTLQLCHLAYVDAAKGGYVVVFEEEVAVKGATPGGGPEAGTYERSSTSLSRELLGQRSSTSSLPTTSGNKSPDDGNANKKFDWEQSDAAIDEIPPEVNDFIQRFGSDEQKQATTKREKGSMSNFPFIFSCIMMYTLYIFA